MSSSDGQQNGYWLIDDKGVKQPLWHTHHDFYQKSRRYVTDFRQKEGRVPTSEEFRRFALGILDAGGAGQNKHASVRHKIDAKIDAGV